MALYRRRLGNTRHDYHLPICDFINLNIDLNIHGVGVDDDTWGAKIMEKCSNSGNKPYHFGFMMEYIGKQQLIDK